MSKKQKQKQIKNQDEEKCQDQTPEQSTAKTFEDFFERLIFASRWLLAPLYLGMAFMLLVLVVKFFGEIAHIVPSIFSINEKELVIAILSLIDMCLMGNLIVIVVFNGYESFISKIEIKNIERMDWMGKVGFSTLKVKLISSIIAIASVDMLKVFINAKNYTESEFKWRLIIYLALVISGVALAFMDKLAHSHHKS
ncbi:TIGR00645 family protein [Candidatus Uabimicrobium amorphum]|uniref:UPF0114 protein UABAM_00926 n=1 Tax=Uabimicrobium amorphum TaxID=2596890 RepID=A0A5S9IIS6_UABAM|nr:TIGR00645 family protein [Candidatus Uabimicrobium amorphum]BBM82583.1 UPF0114 protein [Candidatus Uabimicrobium amorphum]